MAKLTKSALLHSRCKEACHGSDWKLFINYGGMAAHGLPDCSCGCRWFAPLADCPVWGVCLQPEGEYRGSLVFECWGCKRFETEG